MCVNVYLCVFVATDIALTPRMFLMCALTTKHPFIFPLRCMSLYNKHDAKIKPQMLKYRIYYTILNAG